MNSVRSAPAVALGCAIAITGCGPALLNAVAAAPEVPVTVVEDVAYGPLPRQAMDLYRPEGEGPWPLLVFFHGGSWREGSKEAYAFAGRRFAAEGYLTAAPSYRLAPEHPYPAFMEDAAAAVARLVDVAEDMGGDPSRLFLTGHSAGAFIAVQLALASEFLDAEGLAAETVDGVAGISGPYDFLPLDERSTIEAFGPAPDLRATQPVLRVRVAAPPTLLIHGTDDDVVSPRQTRALAEALRAAGAPVETRFLEGAGHLDPLLAIAFFGRAPVVETIGAFFESLPAGRQTRELVDAAGL